MGSPLNLFLSLTNDCRVTLRRKHTPFIIFGSFRASYGNIPGDNGPDVSWNLRNGLVPPDRSLHNPLRRRRGAAACTDKEHVITGLLHQEEGGFAILFKGKGTRPPGAGDARGGRAQGQRVHPVLQQPPGGDGLDLAGGGGLLTAVSSRYEAKHKVISFTELVP